MIMAIAIYNFSKRHKKDVDYTLRDDFLTV